MNQELLDTYYKWDIITPLDRTNTLLGIMPVSSLSPPPKMVSFNMGVKDVISLRAKEIAKINKEIYLLWSGGIDSTTAFYALISEGIKFTVLMGENTHSEHPALYRDITQLNKYPNVKHNKIDIIETLNPEECVIVTGDLGDQIFGNDMVSRAKPEKRITPYYETRPAIFEKYLDPILNKVIGDISDFNLVEYSWLLGFIFRYRVLMIKYVYHPVLKNYTIVPFFHSDEFQLWSMNNFKEFINFSDFTDYKLILKKYIYSINSDENYFKYKNKVNSIKKEVYLKPVRAAHRNFSLYH